jgi:Flp pilus assembly protein CpaB
VDEVKGVAGHLTANDRVDVLGTFTMPSRVPNAAPEFKTKTLLQCVSVLAVGPAPAGSQSSGVPTSVTLKVTPEEAALLSFAETVGQLRLILRNFSDTKIAENASVIDFSTIFEMPTISRERHDYIKIVHDMKKDGLSELR